MRIRDQDPFTDAIVVTCIHILQTMAQSVQCYKLLNVSCFKMQLTKIFSIHIPKHIYIINIILKKFIEPCKLFLLPLTIMFYTWVTFMTDKVVTRYTTLYYITRLF